MGFMSEQETPGATRLVLGDALSRHVGERVAFMGTVQGTDDAQVQLRVVPAGGEKTVVVNLQEAEEFRIQEGASALIVGTVANDSRITEAYCSAPHSDAPDAADSPSFNAELYQRAVETLDRFPQMYKTSPPP